MYYSPYKSSSVGVRYHLPPSDSLWPLESLYFCDQCSVLLSRHDCMDDFDSYYCLQCLENMPSSEANTHQNKCPKCFDCPRCFHVLSIIPFTTTASANVDLDEEDLSPEKEGCSSEMGFMFSCNNCFWDSSVCGIQAPKPEDVTKEAVEHESRAAYADDMRHLVSAYMKNATEGLKCTPSRGKRGGRSPGGKNSLQPLMRGCLTFGDIDRFRGSEEEGSNVGEAGQENEDESGARGRWNIHSVEESLRRKELMMFSGSIEDHALVDLNNYPKSPQYSPTASIERAAPLMRSRRLPILEVVGGDDAEREMEALQSALNNEADPFAYASREQRLRAGHNGSLLLRDFVPQRKPLLTKRSHRHATCRRLLVRASLNPSVANFREKNNSAIYFIPALRISAYGPTADCFKDDASRFVPLKERASGVCDVTFLNLSFHPVEVEISPFVAESVINSTGANYKAEITTTKFTIPPSDDTVEAVPSSREEGDPSAVISRTGNSVKIRFPVTPLDNEFTIAPTASFCLNMEVVNRNQQIKATPVVLLDRESEKTNILPGVAVNS